MAGAATPQDIRDAVKVVGGKLVLTAATLGSDAISAILDEYGEDKTLIIDPAEIVSKPDDPFVTVSGGIAMLSVKSTGSVRFYIDAAEAQLDLAATPPGGWTLGDSFPALSGSDLAAMPLGSPSLRLLSRPTADGSRGLTLSAGFQLPPALDAVRWFAAPDAHAMLAGPIELDAGTPSMVLSVSPSIKASLGGFVDIDLVMQQVATSSPGKGDAPASVAALSQLSGNLAFSHSGTNVEVPLLATFTGETGILHLQLVTGKAFDLALAEISHWLGGVDLGSDGLPASYKPPGGLTLHDVDFAIGLRTKKLEYVRLTVQSTEPWPVADKIVVTGIVLRFMVMPAATPSLSATITGTLALGTAATFDIYAQVPDFLIRGGLAEDSVIDLIPLIEYLGGTTAMLPRTLQIDTLSFEAHPSGSHYAFDIDVIGDWPILDVFTLEELRASLRYDNSELDVGFQGRFLIGSTDLDVSAEYNSELGGWLFSGRAGDRAPIRIGDFIADLTAHFSSTAAQALPDFITSLEIEHLGVTYDTVRKDFSFQCETHFTIEGKALALTLKIGLSKGDGKYTQLYSGALVIGSMAFELAFEAVKADDPTQASSIFLAAVQPDEKIDVRSLVAEISADAGALMPALTLDLENVMFLYRKVGTAPGTYLFGLALGVDLDLSSLPLVGSVIKDAKLGAIKDVQALFASAAVSADDVTTFNALLTEVKAKPPLPTRKDAAGATPVLAKGFNFAADIELGGSPTTLMAGGTNAPPSTAPAPPAAASGAPADVPAAAAAAKAVPPSGNASWFDVKKSVGPVTLERIGVRYQDSRAWLLVDADFMLAGLTLGLEGLALGLKLDDPADLAVNIDGMSLDFESGPLSIAGGFLHLGDDYLGEARVKAATFGLTAIGGYAPGERSFFIFARLTTPLGGPPFFFVTGIAAGFGVNRTLVIPPIDNLTSFALLPANNQFPATLDGPDPGQTLAATLAATEAYIHPFPGANWAAAGLDFTSFEMVDSSALVTVAFGIEFSVALLGISRVTVPKLDPEPIVYLEITLEAQVKPAAGLLAVDGRLTPASYIYAQLCRVTGGFAFYLWFAGPDEGDFVISIGGYHPRFTKPPHYPAVPRLQIVYKIGNLVVKGQSYLALTPHMVMAGLQIDATWEAGSLSAWFSAGIDFLLGWRPFHYEADAYVHIGVSLTIDLLFTSVRITIHVGVDLNIWGPPFGGKASIDLDIVSFTIYFGDDPRREAVDWEGFKNSFLPAGSDKAAAARQPAPSLSSAATASAAPSDGLLCTGTISDGLVRDLKAKDPSAFFSWIVDANHFVLQSRTLIPAKQATFNIHDLQMPFTSEGGFKANAGEALPTPDYDEGRYPHGVSWSDKFGVLPMQMAASGFSSHHIVELKKAPEGADYTLASSYVQDVDDVAVGPLLKASSAALWAPADPGLNGGRLIGETLVGLRVTPMAQHPDITFKADLWAMLFDQNQQVSSRTDVPAADRSDSFAASADGPNLKFTLGGAQVVCTNYQLSALTDAGASTNRKAVVAGLNDLGFAFDPEAIDVADLAAYPLWDWPMIRTLGEEVEAS